jgi:AbrB family looped-hinge helix DNA binding protein
MHSEFHIYRVKVQSSGRITLPVGFRERHRVAPGDMVTLIDDAQGLHIKTRNQLSVEPPVAL